MNTSSTPTELPAGTWTLDASACAVTVTAKKLGFITVPAQLTVVSGTIEIDEHHQVVDVDVVADASSYTSTNPKRDEHVKGDDFLAAATHPTITFRADSVTSSGDGFASNGTVTVKGTSAPVEVRISNVEIDGSTGSFVATAHVDRTAIGVDKLPGFVIGRQLELTVNVTATQQP